MMDSAMKAFEAGLGSVERCRSGRPRSSSCQIVYTGIQGKVAHHRHDTKRRVERGLFDRSGGATNPLAQAAGELHGSSVPGLKRDADAVALAGGGQFQHPQRIAGLGLAAVSWGRRTTRGRETFPGRTIGV